MGKPWEEVENAYMKAHKFLPSRAEPLFEICKHYRIINDFEKGYKYGKLASIIPYPETQTLFLYKDVYEYKILDELSICAYYIGKFKEGKEICENLLKTNIIPFDQIERINKNLEFCINGQRNLIKSIKEYKEKSVLVFYIGYTKLNQNSLYGSELALINLAQRFQKYYDVYIFGKTLSDKTENEIHFRNSLNLSNFVENNQIDILIISRYIYYFIEYPIKANKIYLWLHDRVYHWAWNSKILPNGGKYLVYNVLDKINSIVALSDWHKNFLIQNYSLNNNKISIIGNGIVEKNFTDEIDKVYGRFIWTSSPDRGLKEMVQIFHKIHDKINESELYIFWGEEIFKTENFKNLYDEIKSCQYIHYKGKLTNQELAREFCKSDIWMYPTFVPETYCMSALEAQAGKCFCITSNLGALNQTVGNRGIIIDGDIKSEEVQSKFVKSGIEILKDDKKKIEFQQKSYDWAINASWDKRADEWILLFSQ